MNPSSLTIGEAINGLIKRDFSSVELVTSCLNNIKKFNSKINAFITICEEEALKEAAEADELIRHQDKSGIKKPLLGIPVAVKDNFCAKNIRTTAASKVLEDYVSVYDATVVARLRKAGAVIIGKANHDAWAHGSSGENSDFGPTKNPWNPDYVPGGSGSGSAAAVAADMCLGATGTDTGGSVRLPASFCNLVGLKPTYGRVSRYGIVAMASSLDSVGHLTKTVADSALILETTAGHDGKDATCPEVPVQDFSKNLKKEVKGIRVGIAKEYFVEGTDPKIEKLIRGSAKVLEKLGAKLVEVSLPYTNYANAVYYIIQTSEVSSNLARYDGVRYGFGREKFADEAKRRIMLGTYSLSSGYYDQYYLRAQRVRTLIRRDFNQAFTKCDCLLAPVSPTHPFQLGEKADDPLKMYLSDIFTVTANLAGIPALSIPAGFVNGLPVGLQISGPQFTEDLLFQVAYAFEQETKYYKQKPRL